MAASGFFFGLTAAVVSLVTPPTYRAEVLLAPVRGAEAIGGLSAPVGQVGGLASFSGLSLGGDDQTAEAVAVLRSRSLTEHFVRERNLLPILFSEAWDSEKKVWREPAITPSMGDALLLFDNRIRSVRRDLQTGLVTLRIDWRDRDQAALWANELVAMANETLRVRAIEEADRSLEYLGDQLRQTSNVELRSALATLMQNQLQTRVFASVRQDFAFRVIDPAVPPDPDKRVSPQRTVMTLAGFFGGLVLCMTILAFGEYVRDSRALRRSNA
jgi:uncharacterized protein involved in exopolysaccharide biosynthesis